MSLGLLGFLALMGAGSSVPKAAFENAKHRGMCYAHAVGILGDRGYGSAASGRSLDALKRLGVDWISVTPFGFQRDSAASTFGWESIDESDERLGAVTLQAHARGIRVMLKPHIWLRPPAWPGSIEPADWAQWFQVYARFLSHYATLAQQQHMDALCIGNELAKTTSHEGEWRALIAIARHEYSGPLTYGAEMEEVFSVPFWDALDFIGVSGYYPLAPSRSPDRATLVAEWRPVLARLAALAKRTERRIVFTEVGYRSADFGTWKQWEITRSAPSNPSLQAAAYEAFFEAVWPEPWCGGAYFWKWFSYLGHSTPDGNEWELENKPAQDVLARHYGAHPRGSEP